MTDNKDIGMLLDAYKSVCETGLITEVDERTDYDVPVINKIEIDSISNIESGIPETSELYRSDDITSINRDDSNLEIKGRTVQDDIITIIKNTNNDEMTVKVVSDNGSNLFTYTGRNQGPDGYIQLPVTDGRFGIMIKQQDVR
jgi:hypothetical protein